MAIIGQKGAERGKMPATKIAVWRNRRGSLSVANWPKHTPRRKTQKLADSVYTFDSAIQMLRLVSAAEQQAVKEQTKGTQWRARDWHMAMMYGTIYLVELPDGRRLYPMSAGTSVSQSLDSLGYEEGSILIRLDDQWQAIPPGTAGQVLVSNGPGQVPTWQDLTP